MGISVYLRLGLLTLLLFALYMEGKDAWVLSGDSRTTAKWGAFDQVAYSMVSVVVAGVVVQKVLYQVSLVSQVALDSGLWLVASKERVIQNPETWMEIRWKKESKPQTVETIRKWKNYAEMCEGRN